MKAQTGPSLPCQDKLQPSHSFREIPWIKKKIQDEVKLTLKQYPGNQPLKRTRKDVLNQKFQEHKTGKKQNTYQQNFFCFHLISVFWMSYAAICSPDCPASLKPSSHENQLAVYNLQWRIFKRKKRYWKKIRKKEEGWKKKKTTFVSAWYHCWD